MTLTLLPALFLIYTAYAEPKKPLTFEHKEFSPDFTEIAKMLGVSSTTPSSYKYNHYFLVDSSGSYKLVDMVKALFDLLNKRDECACIKLSTGPIRFHSDLVPVPQYPPYVY